MSSDEAVLDRIESSDWQPVTLGNIVRIVTDGITAADLAELPEVHHYSLPAFDLGVGPEIGPGMTIKSNKTIVPADCVLFSKLNPRIPRIWRVSGAIASHSYCSTEFWPLVARGCDVDLDYLTQYLGSDGFLGHPDISPSSSTNSHQRVDRKAFERFKFLLPPLVVQRRIAQVLRSVNEAIVAERAAADQHIRLIDALFEAWSNLDAPTVTLGELLSFKNGVNFEKDERADEGTLTLDVMNMFSADMTPTYEGAYRIHKAVPSDLMLRSGDILFVRSSVKQQGVGWTSLADGFGEETTFCGFIIRGRLRRSDVLPRYVVGVLRAPKYRRWLIQHSTRSALTNINQKTLSSLEIPVPNVEQQRELVGQYEQLSDAASHCTATLVKLEKLRQHVTDNLLSGHIRVPA